MEWSESVWILCHRRGKICEYLVCSEKKLNSSASIFGANYTTVLELFLLSSRTESKWNLFSTRWRASTYCSISARKLVSNKYGIKWRINRMGSKFAKLVGTTFYIWGYVNSLIPVRRNLLFNHLMLEKPFTIHQYPNTNSSNVFLLYNGEYVNI